MLGVTVGLPFLAIAYWIMPCSKVWIHSHRHTGGLKDMQLSICTDCKASWDNMIFFILDFINYNLLDPPAKDADTFHVLRTSSTLSYCPSQFYKQTCTTGLKIHGSNICIYLGSLVLITGCKATCDQRLCLCVWAEFSLWRNLKSVWLWQQRWMPKATSRLITPRKPDWMDVKVCCIILVWSCPKGDTSPCYLNQAYPL